VLEKAGLKVCRVGKHDALLNSDEHKNYIQERLNQNPSDYRPDITHQCLLTLMDSPLNRAGMLKVYITTIDNHVIELHPKTGIPRTFRKFAELMVQLMKKLRIRAN
jgi:rRNA small subunit pseudouridine methyltransferase Nep1